MYSWSTGEYFKVEQLDNQGTNKNISVNYSANTSRTTLSQSSGTLKSDGEINEFISSFDSSYTVQIPSIYTIFGHSGNFNIYSVD